VIPFDREGCAWGREVIPDPTLWGLLVVASLVRLLTPGPAVLYIVARSIQQGPSQRWIAQPHPGTLL
jgi:hypothetical protein